MQQLRLKHVDHQTNATKCGGWCTWSWGSTGSWSWFVHFRPKASRHGPPVGYSIHSQLEQWLLHIYIHTCLLPGHECMHWLFSMHAELIFIKTHNLWNIRYAWGGFWFYYLKFLKTKTTFQFYNLVLYFVRFSILKKLSTL